MADFCDGKGDLVRDGCCYVDGQVCPLRWLLADGGDGQRHIYEGPSLTDLGTVTDYVNAAIPNRPGRRRAEDAVAGVAFVCSAAIATFVEDAKLLNDRPGFEVAWDAKIEELAPEVHAHFDAIGIDRCPVWKPEGQCCFKATHVADTSAMDAGNVALRQSGGRAGGG